MQRRIILLLTVLLLALSGCSLRLPMLPEIREVEVAAVVKSKPLDIGGAGETSVSADDFAVVVGKKIDANGALVDGNPEDTVLQHSVSNVSVPSDLGGDDVELGVEALHFKAELPAGSPGGTAVVVLTAPGKAPVTLQTEVNSGANIFALSDADRAALSALLSDVDALDVDLLLDGGLAGMSLSDLQVQAALITGGKL